MRGFSLSTTDVAHLAVALVLLILTTHTIAHVFGRLRQPPVVGEILAGLLLGPTVLGLVAPRLQAWIFPASGVTADFIAATAQIGLLLLMFLTGNELRVYAEGRERRVVAAVSLSGLLLPFALGLASAALLDPTAHSGPHGSRTTFVLVFGIAVAVTSIPVISRIMLDLRMLHTSLARVVLTVAVIEDVVLYVVLAIALSLAQPSTSDDFGLWSLFAVDSTVASVAYHLGVDLLFFVVAFAVGPYLVSLLLRHPGNVVNRRSPSAFRLLLLLSATLVCTVTGINPIFGALIAGATVARVDAGGGSAAGDGAAHTLRQFALAFFVPVYFAVVGLNLDLIRNFDPLFFVAFLALACASKAASVWLGARVSGWNGRHSIDLAIALNARGGPGIVLATVTLAAGIIDERFFTTLVLVSVLTSQLAGAWLDHRFGPSMRPVATPAPVPVPEAVERG